MRGTGRRGGEGGGRVKVEEREERTGFPPPRRRPFSSKAGARWPLEATFLHPLAALTTAPFGRRRANRGQSVCGAAQPCPREPVSARGLPMSFSAVKGRTGELQAPASCMAGQRSSQLELKTARARRRRSNKADEREREGRLRRLRGDPACARPPLWPCELISQAQVRDRAAPGSGGGYGRY